MLVYVLSSSYNKDIKGEKTYEENDDFDLYVMFDEQLSKKGRNLHKDPCGYRKTIYINETVFFYGSIGRNTR